MKQKVGGNPPKNDPTTSKNQQKYARSAQGLFTLDTTPSLQTNADIFLKVSDDVSAKLRFGAHRFETSTEEPYQ